MAENIDDENFPPNPLPSRAPSLPYTPVTQEPIIAPTVPVLPAPPFATKYGRHSRFTSQEDLITLREVSACSSNIKAFGEARKRYEEATRNLSKYPAVAQTFT
eukprot:IDg5620t1